jgi:hypothetical protein
MPHNKLFLPNNSRTHSFLLVTLSIVSMFALGSLVYFVPPTFKLTLGTLQIPIIFLFFLLLFVFLFAIGSFLFKSKIHGILIALLAIVYLVFRLNNLTHPFFAVLLLALFLVLELLFTYRK